MKRTLVALAAIAVLGGTPSASALGWVSLGASPNPAVVGERVQHAVTVGTLGRLELWVSAKGFDRPGLGTLPSGSWTKECCPAQTAGTTAWHYRSTIAVTPGEFRFGARSRRTGTFLSSAMLGAASTQLWVHVNA